MAEKDTWQPSESQADLAHAKRALLDQLVQEIRTPLAAIAGLAGTLEDDETGKRSNTAALIVHSSEQLVRRLDLMLEEALLDVSLRDQTTDREDRPC